MEPPVWSQSLIWNGALTVAAVRGSRANIPEEPGLYVFSKAPFAGKPAGILYVGIATRSLRGRLSSYLGLPESTPVLSTKHPGQVSSSLRHAGKVQILMEVMHGEGNNVWLSWACYHKPALVEGALIDWLKPAYNSRPEAILLNPHDSLPS